MKKQLTSSELVSGPVVLPGEVEAAAVVAELNGVRGKPAEAAQRLGAVARRYAGKLLQLDDVQRDTLEGAAAANDAALFFSRAAPMPALAASPALAAAAAAYATAYAAGTAPAALATRCAEQGARRGRVAECIICGARGPADAVTNLLLDDGTPARTNRARLTDPAFRHVGVASCAHPVHGNVTCIVLATDAPETEGAGASPGSARRQAAPAVKTTQIIESADNTAYEADLGKAPADPAQLSLVKKGAFVVLRDGSQQHRWKIPFEAPAAAMSARVRDGRIVLSIAKKTGGEVEIIPIKENDVIPGVAGAAPRPEVQLVSSAPEKIVAAIEVAAVDNTYSVRIVQEDAARSTIGFEFAFKETGTTSTGVCTKVLKSQQTIRLPFFVTQADVVVTRPDNGKALVEITAPKPKPYNDKAPEEPISFSPM